MGNHTWIISKRDFAFMTDTKSGLLSESSDGGNGVYSVSHYRRSFCVLDTVPVFGWLAIPEKEVEIDTEHRYTKRRIISDE